MERRGERHRRKGCEGSGALAARAGSVIRSEVGRPRTRRPHRSRAVQADSKVDNFRLIGMMQTAMPATLDRTDANPTTGRSVFVFRFASTVVLWSVALLIIFSGYEYAFYGLISVGGPDRALGILRDARCQRAAQLQGHGHALWGCDALRQFLLLRQIGPARSYDFEFAVYLFLLTVFTRQMFASLRDDEPLKTMAYTLFGLLYVIWLYNFITKIVYVTPRTRRGV